MALSDFRWQREGVKYGLVLITVLYVFWQISLSGAILTARDLATSQRLSSMARYTVGFGGFLFFFRLSWSRKFIARLVYGRWLIPLGVGLLAGALFILAEDTLVNHYAARTDGQQRLDARTIQLFNAAFLEGRATLPALASGIASDPIKSRAFLKVLGFAIWNNPQLIAQINSERASLVAAMEGDKLYQQVDEGYATYVKAYGDMQKLEADLLRIPYAEWATMLNKMLENYSSCSSDACRTEITAIVSRYLAGYMQRAGLPLELNLNLDAFCHSEKSSRYVMGRLATGGERRICSATEGDLMAYVDSQVAEARERALATFGELPATIRERLLNAGDFITLDNWREMFASALDQELANRVAAEFGDPGRYAENGSQAAEGRDLAISIFLPPIALGFSVFVCLLHLANVLTMLFKRPLIWIAGAIVLGALPLAFATAIPLAGFAGVYGRWLVEWESILYPFGIFRSLIL